MGKFEKNIPDAQEVQTEVYTIIGYSTYSNRKKIDAMLEIAANLRSQLGLDSTARERDHVSKMCRILYRGIKKVDAEVGNILLRTQDGKE